MELAFREDWSREKKCEVSYVTLSFGSGEQLPEGHVPMVLTWESVSLSKPPFIKLAEVAPTGAKEDRVFEFVMDPHPPVVLLPQNGFLLMFGETVYRFPGVRVFRHTRDGWMKEPVYPTSWVAPSRDLIRVGTRDALCPYRRCILPGGFEGCSVTTAAGFETCLEEHIRWEAELAKALPRIRQEMSIWHEILRRPVETTPYLGRKYPGGRSMHGRG